MLSLLLELRHYPCLGRYYSMLRIDSSCSGLSLQKDTPRQNTLVFSYKTQPQKSSIEIILIDPASAYFENYYLVPQLLLVATHEIHTQKFAPISLGEIS